MKKDRAHWVDDETKLLLNLALQEKEKFNFNHQGLTNTDWSNVYTYFPHYDKKQCNNKLGSLKQSYLKWKDELIATSLRYGPMYGRH
jgi:GTPase SAR1 family protein